jgi:hypothetical protein
MRGYELRVHDLRVDVEAELNLLTAAADLGATPEDNDAAGLAQQAPLLGRDEWRQRVAAEFDVSLASAASGP